MRVVVSFVFFPFSPCAWWFTDLGFVFALAHTRIMFATNKEVQWLDYVPSPVLLVKATNVFCAVAMQDGSVNVYSPNGRRCVSTSLLGIF